MKNNLFITRKELAEELGVCPKTLYRRLKKYDYVATRTLLSPVEQEEIKRLLGFIRYSTDG